MLKNDKLPIGFAMALAQHTDAMAEFASLTDLQQEKVIERAKQMHTKREMQNYVESKFKQL